MTNLRLGESYVKRARGRLPFLRPMQAAGLHADVVRELREEPGTGTGDDLAKRAGDEEDG
jgi:hypothetical protein